MKIKPSTVKKQKTLIIDVRTPKEYKEKHIPGSFNIPLNEIPKYKDELSKLDKNISFLCKSGNRASQACDILKENKINPRSIEGGIQAWEQEGYPVKYGPKTWDLERQVRMGAGSIVLVGVALGLLVNPFLYAISAFVGLGLMYSAVTNTCGMAFLLSRAPWNKVKTNTGHTLKQIKGETA